MDAHRQARGACLGEVVGWDGMSETETLRHQCEVRSVLRWRALEGREWVGAWLAGVAKARGSDAADRLRDDAVEQWDRGNRGEPGRWE